MPLSSWVGRAGRAFALAIMAAMAAAADTADATAIDPDALATAINATWKVSGTRDDQGRFDGVITFMEPGTGRIREIRGFSHGVAEGLFTAYDASGHLRVQGRTHLGKAVGTWVVSDAKGVVLAGFDCDDAKHPLISATAAAAAANPGAPHDGE